MKSCKFERKNGRKGESRPVPLACDDFISEPEPARAALEESESRPIPKINIAEIGGGPYLCGSKNGRSKNDGLAASAIAAAATAATAPVAAAAATAGLARLKAVLAIHGTVSAGLERNRGLLSASGADHACPLRCTATVPAAAAATAALFVLLGLAARFAALRR